MPEEETLIIHSDLDELGIPTSEAVDLPIYPVNPNTTFLFSYYLEIYKFSTPELIHQINRTGGLLANLNPDVAENFANDKKIRDYWHEDEYGDRVLRALFRKLMKEENRPSWLNSIAEKDLKETELQNKIKDAIEFYYAVSNDKENEEFNKEKLEKIIRWVRDETVRQEIIDKYDNNLPNEPWIIINIGETQKGNKIINKDDGNKTNFVARKLGDEQLTFIRTLVEDENNKVRAWCGKGPKKLDGLDRISKVYFREGVSFLNGGQWLCLDRKWFCEEVIKSVLNNEDGIFIRGAIPGQCELRKSEEIETFIKQKNQEAVEELIKANNQSEYKKWILIDKRYLAIDYDDAELSFYHIRSDNEIEQECLRKIIADNLGLKDASKMYILDEAGNSSIFPIYSNSDVFLIAIDINEARKDIKKRDCFAISDFCISLIEDFEEIFEKIGYYNAEDLLFIEDKLIENNIEKGISYRDYLKENFGIKGNKIIQFNYNSEYLIENRERFIKGLKKNGQQKKQVPDNYLTNFSEQEQLLNQIEVPFENW
ncbi:MAG: hypothetical protein MRERV_27c016 [Mycoplasmataceae bacterium RV_VA103A]|nr:MAG: hypothetical protein MRERV_27c016 [Mycoplasmataceae bacterium RV_VA103A]